MYTKSAIVLLSGGLDSTVLAHHLKAEGFGLHLLSVHYGQRHEREILSAQRVAAVLGAPIKVVDLSVLRGVLSASALTSDAPMPHGHYEDESMRATVVPNRNAILLSVAFGYAVTMGAQAVGYAAHAGDHAIYPDCRPEFVQAFAAMQAQAVYPPAPELVAPFLEWTKAGIVSRGAELDVPFGITWSCYEGGDRHCGKCGTCTERKWAFAEALVADPTEYLA